MTSKNNISEGSPELNYIALNLKFITHNYRMLINLSNHPLSQWSSNQLNTALKKYKAIVDIPFPQISPNASALQIKKKAAVYLAKCIKLISKSSDKHNAVHIMGELTFTYSYVTLAKLKNVICIASTASRNVKEEKHSKTSYFNFIKFREY